MASLQQQLGSVRNSALKGQTIPEVPFNQAKLEMTFGFDKAGQLIRQMADERDIAETNSKLFQTSQTQPLQRAATASAVRKVSPLTMEIGLPTFAASQGNNLLAAALGGAALARRGVQMAGQAADRSRNLATANMLTAAGQDGAQTLRALSGAAKGAQRSAAITRGAAKTGNLLLDAAPLDYDRWKDGRR